MTSVKMMGLISLISLCASVIHVVANNPVDITDIKSIPHQTKFGEPANIIRNIFRTENEIEDSRNGRFNVARVVKRYVWWRANEGDFLQTRSQTHAAGISSKMKLNRTRRQLERSQRLSIDDVLGFRTKRDTTDCCETEYVCISPVNVEYSGVIYDVYSPSPDQYQIYFEGECPSSTTCNAGTCTVENGSYIYIAVVDYSLPYWPPIKFVPLVKSNHCFCATTSK